MLKMKQLRFFISILLMNAAMLQAQVTITNATFPAAGDTLRTATDLNPVGISITPPGGNQAWDFTALQASSHEYIVVRPASAGTAFASYPGAELVTIDPNSQTETYFDVNATKFSLLGFSGEAPAGGIPIQADFKYSPPFVEKRAPLNFFDINQELSSLTLAFSVASIPQEIFDSLGIPTGLFDSIRINIAFQRLDVVDGWGTLAIPGGMYDVLREKRTSYTTTSLDIHVAILGWVPISTLFGGQIPGLGTDTTIMYLFHSNAAKENIAAVTTDGGGLLPVEVSFKDNGVISRIGDLSTYSRPEVMLSPNPAFTSSVVTLKNIPQGNYQLQVFDATGSIVLIKPISNSGETIEWNGLGQGIHFYRLLDDSQKVLAKGKVSLVGN